MITRRSADGQPINIVCRLTPPMTSALATIGVHGADAISIVRSRIRAFTPTNRSQQRTLETRCHQPSRVYFAHWPLLNGSASEEVVVCATNSRTVEIHCHGGIAVSNEILQDLQTEGCVAVDWATWSKRTSHPGRQPVGGNLSNHSTLEDARTEAESCIRLAAERMLIAATSERCAGILLDQYHGALWRSFRDLELKLDREDWPAAAQHVDQLLGWSHLGVHLAQPWSVVLAGPPNVGKSSLMNALSGQTLSLVHPQAGTTRDWIECTTQIDGWPVNLTDTAGLRDTEHEIEKEGVSRAKIKLAQADLVVVVVDCTVGWTDQHEEMLALCLQRSDPPRLVQAWNKSDRMPTTEPSSPRKREFVYNGRRSIVPAVFCSAFSHTEILWKLIAETLVPQPPPMGVAVPFTESQIRMLQQLSVRLRQPRSGIALDWEIFK